MSRAIPPRAWRAAVLLAVCASTASCTFLYLFNSDPEGLPCDFTNSDQGACLDGYVCVNVESGDPDNPDINPVCLKAGAKKKGEACARNEECDSDLTCNTRFAACTGGGDDFNCDLVSDADKNLACRTVCDPQNPTATCNADEACVDLGDGAPFCQSGTCTSDSDCNVHNGSGFCIGEGNPPSKIGFCFEACNPLACSGGQCPDCKGVDGVVDASANCVPLLDEGLTTSNRTMCDIIGTTADFSACDPLGEPCQGGAFCNNLISTGPVCTPWCFFDGSDQGGSPGCSAPALCNNIDGSTIGFCL